MRSTRRLGAFIGAVVVALVLHAAPAGAASAIDPANRPTPIAGRENGRLSNSDLITVVPGCQVARAAGPSLHRLFLTARSVGTRIGARDCYRPISEQVAVGAQWTARGNSACAAQPQYDANGRPVGTSMHGWGKAVDFSDNGRGMSFSSGGYRFLKREAAQLGWNHPGWAEPGGSACPEAWHWEWVGDGGTQGAPPIRADVVALLPSPTGGGYATVTGLGRVVGHGDFSSGGDASSLALNWVIVTGAAMPSGAGHWLVGADGGVFNYGDAGFFGSTGDMRLNAPVIAMAPTPSGRGYWMVASDGGVFTFGDAEFFGSTGSMRLNRPVVGIAPSPTGKGYLLVASDGGIFSFGDAVFRGSTGSMALAEPITGMATTASGSGYWLVASDGGVFSFGDAAFHGSAGGLSLASPVVAMVATPTAGGYWIVGADGGVFNYGDAAFHGSG